MSKTLQSNLHVPSHPATMKLQPSALLLAVVLAICAWSGPARAAFFVNNVAVSTASIPGTYSYGTQDLTGWTGTDITAVSGSLKDSGLMDGISNHYAGIYAPVAAPDTTLTNLSLLCTIDLGGTYGLSKIDLHQGPNNGWWGNLGAEVRVSATSADWATATSIGTVNYGGIWNAPPGNSMDVSFAANNASTRYILFQVNAVNIPGRDGLLWDQMNAYTVPEPTVACLLVAGILVIGRRRR